MLNTVHPDYCLGSFNNIAFSVWHGQLTLAHIPLIKKVWAEVQAANPEGFGVITVVAPEAPMVAADARRPVSALYESFGSALKGASVVVQAPGIKGTAARMVISTLQLVARPPYPMEAHDSLRSAARWMTGKLIVDDPFPELASMIAHYDQQRSSGFKAS